MCAGSQSADLRREAYHQHTNVYSTLGGSRRIGHAARGAAASDDPPWCLQRQTPLEQGGARGLGVRLGMLQVGFRRRGGRRLAAQAAACRAASAAAAAGGCE